jgi:hypothetical protein
MQIYFTVAMQELNRLRKEFLLSTMYSQDQLESEPLIARLAENVEVENGGMEGSPNRKRDEATSEYSYFANIDPLGPVLKVNGSVVVIRGDVQFLMMNAWYQR